ncbi:MAG: dienelactone hydrolase family protein [Candidatus Tectomicrobia bacterium]|uniref:Dienelactone hydrolase family protein n=1 Tax=Tectimicrobiota bacterium TaxID=2528274 RepID=A0A932MNW4_UNCTE|nr:dienelactone hydrolase family protein [Candidatus Tectomicrobia bacterium]
MNRAIIDLYDEFRHTPMPRREFMSRLTQLAGGAAAATSILPLLEGNAEAAKVAPDDPKLQAGEVSYPGPAGPVKAYQARPKGAGALPAVIVIHENRGLNDHIRDVARKAAVAGLHAIAPDLLSRKGGTPPVQEQAIAAIRDLAREDALADLRAGVAFLNKSPQVAGGKVGTVGFCWGGAMVNLLAANEPTLDAAVAFYGFPPDPAVVPKIQAPLFLIYAGNDKRVNERVPAYLDALKKAGKNFVSETYPNVEHAFHNDTGGARYNQKAADDAWAKTVAFLNKHLKG